MPAPVFEGVVPTTSFSTSTSPKSSDPFNVNAGDVVVSAVADEQADAGENYTWGNSGTNLGWTEDPAASIPAGTSGFSQSATATAPGNQTGITGTLTRTTGDASHVFGGVFARWSSATLVGTARARHTVQDTTSPYTLSITPNFDNSAIFYWIVDYSALDFSGRTHQTVNGFTPIAGGQYELAYFRSSVDYTFCGAYIPDAGVGGVAKVVGMTGPASGDVLMVAVEIAGVAGSSDVGPGDLLLTGLTGGLILTGTPGGVERLTSLLD